MSYPSINQNEREAAQGLADLKNYNISMSIWAQSPNQYMTTWRTTSTFDKNVIMVPGFRFRSLSPPEYFSPPSIAIPDTPVKDKESSPECSVYTEETKPEKKKSNNKTKVQKKKSKRKPRWNKDLKNSLSLAIIDHKKLSDVDSFDWHAIGRKTGKSGKACKRQWLTEILPKIQKPQ